MSRRLFLISLSLIQIIHTSFPVNALSALRNDENLNKRDIVVWDIGSYLKPYNKSLTFGLRISAPTAPGRYSVLIFQGGFDGLVYKLL